MDMHPTITELNAHVQNIYTAEDASVTAKIEELSSDVYVPALDDPIDSKEVKEALNDCGYVVEVVMTSPTQFFKKSYAIFSHFSHYSLTAFSTYITL